jgi:hypothetical protein
MLDTSMEPTSCREKGMTHQMMVTQIAYLETKTAGKQGTHGKVNICTVCFQVASMDLGDNAAASPTFADVSVGVESSLFSHTPMEFKVNPKSQAPSFKLKLARTPEGHISRVCSPDLPARQAASNRQADLNT